MTYGWAILIIVIVAAVLYSLGIFNPSASVTATVTGFTGLGSVSAVCLGGVSFTVSLGNSIGYLIEITDINLTSSSNTVTASQDIMIQPNQMKTITIPASSLCSPGGRYSVSAVVSYTEPGQVFPGPYVSTGTAAGTAASLPSSIASYGTLIVNNTQGVGAQSSFQQMVNVTSSTSEWPQISSSPFGQNVEFFSVTGQPLDSWLESHASTWALWWVKLGSILPSSKQTVYMGFASASTNLFNGVNVGEAPQLSPTYAEYDDGANVFNNYWNFAGTSSSLPSAWQSLTSGYSINNGLIFDAVNSENQAIGTTSAVASPGLLEAYITGNYGRIILELSTSNTIFNYGVSAYENGYEMMYGGYTSPPDGGLTEISGTTLTGLGNFGSATSLPQVFGIGWVATGNTFEYTYTSNLLSPTTVSSTNTGVTIASQLYISIGQLGSGDTQQGGTWTVYWIRTRAYPPSGVMPYVSFGSVS